MMVLSDNKIRVPGKMYKVRLKCVSTQRLTTIEWLILNCTEKFENHPTMSVKTLKYAFEEVFQLQNSELLIKPCLRHLRNLNVIQILGGDKFDYDTLSFSDIALTERGYVMLKDGLLPGESREIPLDVYYNPLTGKVSGFNNSIVSEKDVVDFGTESDYSDVFPKESVRNALQAGSLAGGRFTASKFRIEEIDEITSMDWNSTIAITLEANEEKELSTTPKITAENVTRLLSKLYLTREIDQTVLSAMCSQKELQVKNLIGTGKNIKTAILEICKNGKIIFLNKEIYDLYKRNTSSFKGRTVFLFGDKESFSITNDKGLFITLPGFIPVEGCAVVNEKGESISLCKDEYVYEETPIIIPLAVEDERLIKKPRLVISWLEKLIIDNLDKNIELAALYTLDVLKGNLNKGKSLLVKRWINTTIKEVVSDINQIRLACEKLHSEMFNINEVITGLLDKIDYTDYKEALLTAHSILEASGLKVNSQAYHDTVKTIISRLRKPENYTELITLFQNLGIQSHDEALVFDDIVSGLYTESVIKDILTAIAHNRYMRLPELFELDALFNEYVEGLNSIQNYVSGLKLFEKADQEELRKSVSACPDIAGLQSYVAEIMSKNAYLMSQGINVYDTLKADNAEMAEAFVFNLKEIEQIINSRLESVYLSSTEYTNDIQDTKKINKKIYILDTCAIMHNPEILLYFKDDEYVRIPTKVIEELGKIKDKRNRKYSAELSDTARIFARDIDTNYRRLFNKENEVRFMIENAAIDLLPADLDPMVPDNQILSVALKYKNWEVYIVSDDGVFRLTSIAQNIKAITSTEFINSHKDQYKKLADWVKDFNKNNQAKSVAMKVVNVSEQTEQTAEQIDADKDKLSIDDLPIKDLKLYTSMCDENVLVFLRNNKIKTMGDFVKLTESKVMGLPAKGKQEFAKNLLIKIIKQKDKIISQIEAD